jgi:hypothetical protein
MRLRKHLSRNDSKQIIPLEYTFADAHRYKHCPPSPSPPFSSFSAKKRQLHHYHQRRVIQVFYYNIFNAPDINSMPSASWIGSYPITTALHRAGPTPQTSATVLFPLYEYIQINTPYSYAITYYKITRIPRITEYLCSWIIWK